MAVNMKRLWGKVHRTNQPHLPFEKRFKEHFLSFKNKNYNSKFSYLLETGQAFGKVGDIMKILYYDKKEDF
jgi:hypothetical protein